MIIVQEFCCILVKVNDILWVEEVKGKYCHNRGKTSTRLKVADQLECQQKCVAEPECVGISYKQYKILKPSGRCKVCYVPYSMFGFSNSKDWSFYRKPKTPG